METVARADRGEKALSPEQQQRDERRKVYPPLSQDELSRLFAYLRNRAKQSDGTLSPATWALLVLWPNECDPRRPRLRNAPEEHQLYARYTFSPKPWTNAQRDVQFAILRACAPENGASVAFLSLHRLALMTGLSRATVRRVIRQLDEHACPLVQSSLKAQQRTRGVVHRSYRFELVSSPVAFVTARDEARKRVMREVPQAQQAARRSIAPRINALALQWHKGVITEAQLNAEVAVLRAQADAAADSKRLPKRVLRSSLRLAAVGVPR